MLILGNEKILKHQITIYGDDKNETLFSADEVAKIIENKNVSQMLKNIDEDEKELVITERANGGFLKKWYLTKEGVYEVLMQSRNPIAKEFKKEIKRILKQIETNGVYIQFRKGDTIEKINDRINKVLNSLKKELEIKNNKIKSLENFFDEGKDYASISFLANKYSCSYNEFIKILKKNKFIYSKGKELYVYRKFKYKGYVKYFKINGKNVMKFTMKGQQIIDEIFMNLNLESDYE